MAENVRLQKANGDYYNLYFPITENSQKCTGEDIEENNKKINDKKETLEKAKNHYKNAKEKLSVDNFYLEGVESLDVVIERELLNPTSKLLDIIIPNAIEKISTLQQTQQEKDEKIISAYQVAKEAEAAMLKRSEAKESMDSKQSEYVAMLNNPNATDYDKTQSKTRWDEATNTFNTANTNYKDLREKALSLYREAYTSEPKAKGDYDGMIEV